MAKVIIIGAGIVGLATALKLKEKHPRADVTVLEKEEGPAMHQTGNNSGVIHAGVYYKPGSLKAENCISGYRQLLDFCNRETVPYDLCGKLIVATNKEELSRLDNLFQRSQQNGLEKVRKISKPEIKDYEPYVTGLAALHVPYTGIIDYTALTQKYAQLFTEKHGGTIVYGSEVQFIKKAVPGVELGCTQGVQQANFVINTGGLHSDSIADMTEDKLDYRIIPFRGEYVELVKGKEYLVRNLIYPVPDPNFPFLGVHFTRMIGGGIEAGPNAVWAFKKEGYNKWSFAINDFYRSLAWPGFRKVMRQYWKMGMGEYWRSYNKKALAKALQRLIPEVTAKDLKPGGAGVRAQACSRNGGLVDDFLILENQLAINVLNAPSPAATASLAIADTIADLAIKRLS